MDLGTLLLVVLALGTFTFAAWIAVMVRDMLRLGKKIAGEDRDDDPWGWLDK